MRLRQVALAAHDLDAVTDALCDVLGIEIGYRDPGVAVFGLKNAVMPMGDTFLEVVCPVTDDAPARRYLARRGGDCGYMVMVQTASFDADRARVEAEGTRLVWTGELPDIRGMHLHPKDTGGALLSLDEPVPATAWRWAGPDWRDHVSTGRVGGLRDATVACARPDEVAARWSTLLGCTIAGEAGGPRIALGGPDDGFLHFVPAGAPAEEGLVGFTVAARDPASILATARARGLPTDAASVTICGTRIELETGVAG